MLKEIGGYWKNDAGTGNSIDQADIQRELLKMKKIQQKKLKFQWIA